MPGMTAGPAMRFRIRFALFRAITAVCAHRFLGKCRGGVMCAIQCCISPEALVRSVHIPLRTGDDFREIRFRGACEGHGDRGVGVPGLLQSAGIKPACPGPSAPLGEGLFPRMYRSAHGCPSFRTDGIAPLSFCLVRES